MVVDFSIYINLKKRKVFHDTHMKRASIVDRVSSPLRLSIFLQTNYQNRNIREWTAT